MLAGRMSLAQMAACVVSFELNVHGDVSTSLVAASVHSQSQIERVQRVSRVASTLVDRHVCSDR